MDIKVQKIKNGYIYQFKNKKYSLTIEQNYNYLSERLYDYVLFQELDASKPNVYNHIWTNGNGIKSVENVFNQDHEYILNKYFLKK